MTFDELVTEVKRVGGLGSSTDDTTSAEAWAKMGLRKISTSGAWSWLKAAATLTLMADTYQYAISGLGGLFERLDSKSFRYSNTFLEWAGQQAIDEILQPSWKDAATTSSTPEYITRVGTNLWIAPKPSSVFVAAHPTIAGYGWIRENYAEDASINGGALLLPEQFAEAAVAAALAYGWHEEDDPRADTMEARFRQVWIPEMRGFEEDIGAQDSMWKPHWVYDRSSEADYGDS